ncbi:MAG: hypothetical protein Q8L74_01730 [Nitrospirota bacterium]|nr:hypothetical protein [Nitrospirota bacterium]
MDKEVMVNIVILALAWLLFLGGGVGNAAEPKLPDTLGIALGMPVKDAVQRMKELGLAIHAAETNPSNILEKPLLHELAGSKAMMGSMSGESLRVSIATPPHSQVVWQVFRTSQFPEQARPASATILTSLREKYGPEIWKELDGAGHPRVVRWLFDEQGRALTGEANAMLARGCNSYSPNNGTFNTPAGQRDPCYGIVHLEAKINALSKPGVADTLEIKLMHGPLARTFFPATEAWIQEQQAKAANREVEKAKQQGVKPAL